MCLPKLASTRVWLVHSHLCQTLTSLTASHFTLWGRWAANDKHLSQDLKKTKTPQKTTKEMSVEISAVRFDRCSETHVHMPRKYTRLLLCIKGNKWPVTACFKQLTFFFFFIESILSSSLLVCYDSLDKNPRRVNKHSLASRSHQSSHDTANTHTHTRSKGHKQPPIFRHYASFGYMTLSKSIF